MHTSTVAASAAAVDKAINAMIEKAIARQATDIHIEPRERNIVVRFRIDGWLQEIAKLPLGTLSAVVANLKNRAMLDTHNVRTPQNGNFTFHADDYDTAITVATMPTIDGEKVALQLTPQLAEMATIESLGFWGEGLRRIEQAVAEPHGLVIATSPNKTMTSLTLLGIVHLLNNPALNIATLEDPIERHVSGVSQTQVNGATGVTFASGLQAVLQQDPNVVMVGDIHDRDVITTALHASLSGRLILGGLHTSSAAHGISHLLHMHTEPFIVASSLKVATGQRLVRRLCPSCKEAYKPDPSIRKDLKELLHASGITSVKQLHELETQAAESGVGPKELTTLSTTAIGITTLWQPHRDGCPHCHFSGYSGRIGICEVLANSETMQKQIAAEASVGKLHQLAIKEGMLPLQLDGLIKALRGLTTLNEILPLLVAMPK